MQSTPKTRKSHNYESFKRAAEEVFAARGYDGTTIREIATRANCNLGTLSHYWNTKQALYCEIFKERFQIVFDYQMNGFSELEAQAENGKIPRVRDVINCLTQSVFVGFEGAELARRLFGRAVLDPSDEVDEAMSLVFAPASSKMFNLLRLCVPHLDDDEFYWRILCVVGSFAFVDTFSNRLSRFIKNNPYQQQKAENINWKNVSDYVTDFMVAGMQNEPTRFCK